MENPAAQNGLQMRFLIQWVAGIKDGVHRALGEAMVSATEVAYKDAVTRAKTQFNNTSGRVRTGGLMNAIYRGFDPITGKGFLGVQSPYGALQEFGGTVRPVNARHLWVKQWQGVPASLRRMTPREWMAAHRTDPQHFAFYGRSAVYKQGNKAVTMFALADSATIQARPYIRPAVEMAFAQLPMLLQQRLATLGAK